MGITKTVTSATRAALAVATAFGPGILVQSALMAAVLTLLSPATMMFFDFAVTLYVGSTVCVLLVLGGALVSIRVVRLYLNRRGVVVGAVLGALGASVPEIYTCTNPLLRCFLTTPRDTAAGVAIILSGAACGAVVCLVYAGLASRPSSSAASR